MSTDINESKEATGFPSSTKVPILEVISGHDVGKRLRVTERCIVGRSHDCAMVIADRKVSRHHIEITPMTDGLVIRDMKSKNGVFVNGRQITNEKWVRHGDVLLLGETFLSVQLPKRQAHERYGSRMLVTVSTAAETHFDEVSVPEKIGREHMSEEDLRTLLEILCLAQENQDPSICLRRVTKRLVELFHADTGVLCLTSKNDYEPAIIHGKEKKIHFLSNILHKTMLQRKGTLIKNVRKQITGSSSTKASKRLPPSQMCVPFIYQSKIVGLIALGSKRPYAFNKTALNLLTVLANHLSLVVARACRDEMLERVHRLDRESFASPIVGESQAVHKIKRLIDQVAMQPISVLITGETGSGKELVARAIHSKGFNPEGPFVCVNCAAIPAELFEAELFGYEKGAFTGAYQSKPGKFGVARDGTLFFDEIGELPLNLQAKILRVIEMQEFVRLGGNKTRYTNARFLFATNRNLVKMVKDGRFREDLFFRINTFDIHVPPLLERLEDIPLLVDFFLDELQGQFGKARPFRYSPEVIGSFLAYHWPGNIRELRNVLEQMAILSDSGFLSEDFLPDQIRVGTYGSTHSETIHSAKKGLLSSVTDRTQKQMVLQALKAANGQKKQAARILGISRPTLDKKIRNLGITDLQKE